MKKIVEENDGEVKLVLRYAPFHQGADTIAKALEASRRQGKFWEMLDLVYAKQGEWADHQHPRPDVVWQYLPAIGIDVEQLRKDMRDAEVEEVVRQDMPDALALGIRGAPTFLVNGRLRKRFGLSELQALVSDTVAGLDGR